MPLRLVCRPGKTVSWEELRRYPVRTIAVDGYCDSEPQASASGLRINIDHHRNVNPVATRSCCDQALIRVKMGLYDWFQVDGVPDATIYVNDCDQDVVWTTYILMHPEHADRPKLKQFVRLEDLLDMSSGLYPIKNNRKSRAMRQMAWIMQPYAEVRSSGKLHELTGEEMEALILRMHKRIHRALFSRAPELKLDTRFESESRGNWHFVREYGAQARMGMAEAGIKAFVTLVSEQEGVYHYALGRLPDYVLFPVPQILANLNKAEDVAADDKDRWGGGENRGGSPRGRGSKLNPDEVTAVVNKTIAEIEKRAHSVL